MQPETVLQKLNAWFTKYPSNHYSSGHVIMAAFSKTTQTYYLKSGLVRQYVLTTDGKELVTNIFRPGSFFPMVEPMTGLSNRYFFETLTETEVNRAPVEEFMEYLRSEPDLQLDLIRRLYIGIDALTIQMVQTALGDTRKKVVASLVLAAKRFGQESGETLMIPQKFTHQQLSWLSGVSRESVTRELTALKEEKLISIENKYIHIPDLEKLEEILSTDSIN